MFCEVYWFRLLCGHFCNFSNKEKYNRTSGLSSRLRINTQKIHGRKSDFTTIKTSVVVRRGRKYQCITFSFENTLWKTRKKPGAYLKSREEKKKVKGRAEKKLRQKRFSQKRLLSKHFTSDDVVVVRTFWLERPRDHSVHVTAGTEVSPRGRCSMYGADFLVL